MERSIVKFPKIPKISNSRRPSTRSSNIAWLIEIDSSAKNTINFNHETKKVDVNVKVKVNVKYKIIKSTFQTLKSKLIDFFKHSRFAGLPFALIFGIYMYYMISCQILYPERLLSPEDALDALDYDISNIRFVKNEFSMR